MSVGIRDLKLHLSKYLERVRRGETVLVTDRGKPVARLEPVQSGQPPAALQRLIVAGRLVYKPPPRDLPRPIRLLPGNKSSTDYVSEQRR